MKDKILLINPFYEYKNKRIWRHTRVWPPLDLAVAAALLEEKGFNASILDINALAIPTQKAVKNAKDFDKIFITSGSLDRWQCPHLDIDSFFLTVNEVKKASPKAKLYVFGPHVTMRPKEILEQTNADAVILSEPELTIVDLCENKDMPTIDGIAYSSNKEFKITNPRKPIDLSQMPVPAFHLLPMEKYNYEIMGSNFTLLETTRGCPYQCNFCSEDQMYGIRYRKKPIGLIEKEIDACVNKFGVRNVYFIDLEFTLIKSFVDEICNLLLKKGYKLNWACQTRTDTVDLDLLKKMRKAGCKIIHYGVESGSQRILDSTQKNISLDSIRDGIKWAKQAGIEVVCFCMMGLPTETAEDMKMTIDFAKEINPDYISFHVATPYPGTKLYESVKDEVKGLFPTSYEGMYNEPFIKKMTRKAFLEFYLRPGYIFSRLASNPKLLLKQLKLFLKFIT